LGRLIILLFFLSSTGFTSILNICAMEAAKCCGTSGRSDHEACHNESPPVSGVSVKDRFECQVNIVAGGLSGVSGLIEKEIKQRTETTEFVVIALSETAEASFAASTLLSLNHTTNTSPPSVEKYVLNSTFLI